MRIGIIGDALDRQYAGIHYFTKNVIEYLTKLDTNNQYFLFREKTGNENFNCTEIVIPSHPGIPGYQSARLLYKIPRKAVQLELDILIEPAHFGPFNVPETIKRVTVIHDLTPLLFRQWHTFNGWFLQKLFLPGIIKRADLIITNSEYTKTDIVNHLGKDEDKIVPTHLGISDIFKPTDDQNVLGKYGIYKDYILFQGTLEPRKNLVNLIIAYEDYRLKHPDRKEQLILSGRKGWKNREIIEKKYTSRFSDDVILLGYVDRQDMPALYSGASIFAYPSFYEGFGLPVLEAMACGTPIITSNVSSLPEVAGRHAIYFNPSDTRQMSHAMYQASQIPTAKISDQVKYAHGFTWARTVQRIIEALNILQAE